MSPSTRASRPLRARLNILRWAILSLVFGMLILLPLLSVYQNFVASHGYDLLAPSQKRLYNVMAWLTGPFTTDPANGLDAIKGTTWSANFFGYKISDPLAVVGQITAAKEFYLPMLLSAVVPVIVSLIFGRVFCGWICPATFLYELNDNVRRWLQRMGIHVGERNLDNRLKYLVLVLGTIISMVTGSVIFASIYPPALIGRELYYSIALTGFGSGAVFFIGTLLFDVLVARRGFCRYVCPGGALYSLLGRYRLLRIQRDVAQCNDCQKCNVVCQFGLDPWHDGFGQECNNCTACISICPTDCLVFEWRRHDQPDQGPGHLGHAWRHGQVAKSTAGVDDASA